MTITYHCRLSATVLIVLTIFAAGCGGDKGPKSYRVEGTVTLNGTPVDGAAVSFVPDDNTGSSAGGKTDASGKFTLMTSFGTEGAAAGTYSVVITKREAVRTGNKTTSTDENGKEIMVDEMTAKDVLPKDYASVQKTPFKSVTVEAKSSNKFDFDLK